MTIRILIADDHPVVRDGLAAILDTQPDFEVVGEAATGIEVVSQVAALHPDVILLDLEMPAMDGVETLSLLRNEHPSVRALVFTAFDSDERIVSAIAAGAQGYLLKGAPRAELFHAIRVIHGGGSLLQPVVASKLLRRVSEERTAPEPPPQLTPREQDVLVALARGLQNKEIAAHLNITERTVKFHVSAMLTKLQAGNRTELVTNAARYGLVHLDK